MTEIPAGVAAQSGPWGLVVLFAAMVFFGVLVPRWIHNKWISEKNTLIDKLTSALDKRDEQFDILIENWKDVVKQQELTIHLLEEIKKASQRPEKADL